MTKEYTQQAISICTRIRGYSYTYNIKAMEIETFTIIAAIEQQLDPIIAIDRYKKILTLQQEVTGSQLHYANWLQYVNLALAYLVVFAYNSANYIYKSFQILCKFLHILYAIAIIFRIYFELKQQGKRI